MNRPIITLGTWDGKPIEWYVLKEESFGKLLFSRFALFSCNLGWNGQTGTWKDWNVRNYLNGEFYQKAFTDEEKKKILSSFLKEPEETKDDVFLLSQAEVETLMTKDERKCGDGSGCSSGHGCNEGNCDCYQYSDRHGTCCWLRTPFDSNQMYLIWANGNTGYTSVKSPLRSIRPAMWIREK